MSLCFAFATGTIDLIQGYMVIAMCQRNNGMVRCRVAIHRHRHRHRIASPVMLITLAKLAMLNDPHQTTTGIHCYCTSPFTPSASS